LVNIQEESTDSKNKISDSATFSFFVK